MKKSVTSKFHLKQRLYSQSMVHLKTFKEIVANLETLEVKCEEEDLGLILMCSLPILYTTFRDMILYCRDILTLNEVYEALFSKEKIKQLIVGPKA